MIPIKKLGRSVAVLLRFRAWHKTWEEMGQVKRIRFDDDGNVTTVLFKGETLGTDLKIDDIELMQSTGLKDKNGQEIFEADILSDGHTIGDIRNHLTLGFYMIDEKGNEKFLSDTVDIEDFAEAKEFMRNSIEIIGNIYETPELLEADHERD